MSKSIKLKDNTYIDSSGVSYNRNSLKTTLDNLGTYTEASGTYTTAVWADGSNTCIWTAPKTGFYLMFALFQTSSWQAGTKYKQFQLHGTATRLLSNLLLFQADGSSGYIQGITGCTPVYATQGQTIIPYIHTDTAGMEWTIKLFGLFIK